MAIHLFDGVLLRVIHCKWCDSIFFVCRRCYRRQAYCCEQCRKTARRIAHRQAQSAYRTSPKGRKANRLAARKRRIRSNQKTVADQTTTRDSFRDIILPESIIKQFCCSFCGSPGMVVERFPRRGYAGTTGFNSRVSGTSPPRF